MAEGRCDAVGLLRDGLQKSELQIPPLRFASVGMTRWGLDALGKSDGVGGV
jgi:hypothetical protein